MAIQHLLKILFQFRDFDFGPIPQYENADSKFQNVLFTGTVTNSGYRARLNTA